MNIRCIVWLTVVSLAILPSALGQNSLDTWTFRGIITTGLPGSYQAGLPYSAEFVVDTTRLSPVLTGLYYPTLSYDFVAGCCGFGGYSLGLGVLIANDQPKNGGGSFDGIIFSMYAERRTGFPVGTLFDGSEFGVTLVNSSAGPAATPFTDTSFPATLDLNQFSERYMVVYFQSGPVRGSVDSFYINDVLISQVPEPSVFGLFALSGLLLGFSRWHSSRAK